MRVNNLASIVTTLLALCSCAISAEKVTGDENQVSVKAGKGASAGDVATEHCQQHKKEAVLSHVTSNIDASRVYHFDCQ